jgi:hypothetical protein
MTHTVLLITCGALAREMLEVVRRSEWSHVEIQCLPAELHNTPARIPGAIEQVIESGKGLYSQIFVAYGDCGTGGELDVVLAKHGAERLPGAHCYEFLTGPDAFRGFCEEEPGTFYLTDFLVRHFDRLVKRGLGIESHPELMPLYFRNYKRVVYLAQNPTPESSARARAHAEYLGLEYEEHHTGLQPLARAIGAQAIRWRS